MVQAKFLEREVWKPDRPEPDITSNKLKKRNSINILKVSQPRLLFYPGQQENANTNHQIGEPSDTINSVLKWPSLKKCQQLPDWITSIVRHVVRGNQHQDDGEVFIMKVSRHTI